MSKEDFIDRLCGNIESVVRIPTELDQASALGKETFGLVVAAWSVHENPMFNEAYGDG